MFTKLFSSITTSSIWNEDSNTRIVWITMLAMANKNGYVSASVGGLAHEARVEREECEKALNVLSSPDLDSRSKEFEGRRIEMVDGGFQLLNYEKYRAMRSEEERKEYMKTYMAEYRRTKNVNKSVNNVSECKPPLAAVSPSRSRSRGEAEAEADKDSSTKSKKIDDKEFMETLRTSPAYHGIDLDVELSRMDSWLMSRPGRQKTRRFIVNWLNKCDKPVPVQQNGNKKYSFDFLDKKQHAT